MPQSISNYIVRKFYTVHVQSVCKYSIYIYTCYNIYCNITMWIQRFSKLGVSPNHPFYRIFPEFYHPAIGVAMLRSAAAGPQHLLHGLWNRVAGGGFPRRFSTPWHQLPVGDRKRVLVDLNGMIYHFFTWWIYHTRNLGLKWLKQHSHLRFFCRRFNDSHLWSLGFDEVQNGDPIIGYQTYFFCENGDIMGIELHK